MLFGWLLLAYALGSIPWAVYVVRMLHGHDVRTSGSGNIGARNSLRVGGPVAALLVLGLDLFKGVLATVAPLVLNSNLWVAPLCGVAVVCGHCFSALMLRRAVRLPWHGWRQGFVQAGGMGLATGLGVLLVLAPLVALPVVLVGVLIMSFKRPTAAALAMCALVVPLAWWFGYPQPTLVGLGLAATIITIKHFPDIFPASSL